MELMFVIDVLSGLSSAGVWELFKNEKNSSKLDVVESIVNSVSLVSGL